MDINEMLEKYIRTAQSWRGHVIDQTALLERTIDFYIASHFCKEEFLRQELMELIISTDRITFENKRQVFKALTEKHNNEFAKANPKIYNSLTKILEERNVFAHWELAATVEAAKTYFSEDAITFNKYKTAVKLVKYSRKQVQEITDLIFDCVVKISELNNLLRSK